MKKSIKNTALRALSCLLVSMMLLGCTLSCGEIQSPSDTTVGSSDSQTQAPVTEHLTDDQPQTESAGADTSALTQEPEQSKNDDTTQAPQTDTPQPEDATPNGSVPTEIIKAPTLDLSSIPAYTGSPYVAVNNNTPFFSEKELTTAAFELYGELDSLGRCTTAYANVCKETMPTEERGSIGSVKPSGWQTVKYDCVDGKYLYNRCHLIGWQLTAENANTKNLITGTRYMNVEGMLPFENMVADYLKEEAESHVLYRVTPIFSENELVARGVLMEAYSVEDKGDSVSFCVYCYNVQPSIVIDYSNGASKLREKEEETAKAPETSTQIQAGTEFTLNTNTKKFHYPSCSSAKKIADKNKDTFIGTRDEVIAKGYSPCGICKP